MLDTTLRTLAEQNRLTIASGAAYGLLGGCFVTLTSGKDYQRISIYIGPQLPAAEGMESPTVSCANQIIHTIQTASGEENVYALLTGHETLSSIILNHAGSVVTVNFPGTDAAAAGIQRFVTELLPQIAPLTRPDTCICCGQPTGGEGCPVRISGDTVVPMHIPCGEQVISQYHDAEAKPGRISTGLVGALIASALGAAVWATVYHFGYVASIIGLLIGVMASWGYDIFKGRPGKAKTITVLICCILAVVLGTFAGSMIPYVQEYQELGELTQKMFSDLGGPGWFNYFRGHVNAPESNYWSAIFMNLCLGLLFTGVGCLDLLRRDKSSVSEAARPRRLKGRC